MVAWASKELNDLLVVLTPQRALAIERIVVAELEGRSLSSLLDCPDQICTSTTYYGGKKRRGWKDNPNFVRALELARRDYRAWLLEHGVGDALLVLVQTAPAAARALRQQVVGDDAALEALTRVLLTGSSAEKKIAAYRLGDTGNPAAVAPLLEVFGLYDDGELRSAIVHALGTIAGWRNRDQATAALGVLDRADVKTAAKRSMTVDDDDITGAIERELAQLADLRAGAVAGEAAPDEGSGSGGERSG